MVALMRSLLRNRFGYCLFCLHHIPISYLSLSRTILSASPILRLKWSASPELSLSASEYHFSEVESESKLNDQLVKQVSVLILGFQTLFLTHNNKLNKQRFLSHICFSNIWSIMWLMIMWGGIVVDRLNLNTYIVSFTLN